MLIINKINNADIASIKIIATFFDILHITL